MQARVETMIMHTQPEVPAADMRSVLFQYDGMQAQAQAEKGVMHKQLEALGAKLGRTQDECRNLGAQV